ncbi:MAG: hypothetical protein ACE5GC_09635, partial [Acidimicrobiia bacterium]
MKNRDLFIDYRMHVITAGLAVSWMALGVFASAGASGPGLTDATVLYPLIALGVALLGLTILPWRRVLRRPIGDALILLWSSLALFGILIADTFRVGDAVVAAFLAAVVFASALLVPPALLALVAAGALGGYGIELAETPPGQLEAIDIAFRLGAFAVTSLLLVVTARG